MNSSARVSALGLAGFGHVPQEEDPQAFLEVVLPWLRKTPGLLSANPAEGQNGLEMWTRRVYMMENDMFPMTEKITPATPATILEKQLTLIFLLWPAVLIAVTWRSLLPSFVRYWLYVLGIILSPVLAAILIGFALRHRPVLHRFLRVVVGLSLIVLVITNFTCAKTASEGNLLQVLTKYYKVYPAQTPLEGLVNLYCRFVVTLPPFFVPFNDRNELLMLLSLVFQHYSPQTGPFFLLLLLIIPSFLALPVFWLWVVLSVLYVVLPQRAWVWMKAGVVRHSANLRRSKGS